MAQEIKGFGDQLAFFFLRDDHARWKAMRWIIFVVGAAGSLDLVVFNSSIDDAVLLMGALALLMFVAWVGSYCTFRQWGSEPQSPSRRSLVFQAVASTIAFFMSGSLWRLEAKALNANLSQAVKTGDYSKAADVLERARNARVQLDKALVNTTGQALLDATNRPDAWAAVKASLDYKSFVDAPLYPVDRGQAHLITTYEVNVRNGHAPEIYFSGIVPASQAAHFDLIGVNKNESLKYGNKLLIVNGGEIVIDGWDMKSVIFEKSHVIYEGGAIRLENVYFFQCEFDVVPTEAGRFLAKAVLNSMPVSIVINV